MRGRLVGCIFVLTACGAAPEPSSAPAPSTVPAPEQPADPVPARAAIGGRLRAHDGAPLRAAEFTVYRNGFREPAAKGPLAADGSFHGELAPGVYTLVVSAVDHAQLVRTLLVDRPCTSPRGRWSAEVGVHEPSWTRGSGSGSARTEAVDAGAAEVGVHASPVDAAAAGRRARKPWTLEPWRSA